MDWSKGYTSEFYAYIIDPGTWRETIRLQITGGSVNKGIEGLRESADIDIPKYDPGVEKWLRVYMDVRQGGSSAHVPIFTGLATSPEQEWTGNIKEGSLECYSVLKPVDDILLERGYYTPAGANGARIITELLSVCPAPVEVNGASPSMQDALIAEDGETALSMAEKILAAINWRIRISRGNIKTEYFSHGNQRCCIHRNKHKVCSICGMGNGQFCRPGRNRQSCKEDPMVLQGPERKMA